MKHPKFGQIVRNPFASDRNPQRDGFFVEVIRRTSKINPGVWYRLTDGKGAFWQIEAAHSILLSELAEAISKNLDPNRQFGPHYKALFKP